MDDRFDKDSYDKGFHDGHIQGWQRGCDTPSEGRIRIEALRAAAMVIHDNSNPHLDDHAVNTIAVAEQFAAWLETGE